MRVTAGLLLIAALFAFSPALYASDWPQFRGPNANGFSGETGINKNWQRQAPRKLWQVSLSDGGYAGPSVARGKVYIIDHQGKQDMVRALNVTNGRDVWRFLYDDATSSNYGFTRSTPTVYDNRVYTLSRQGHLFCLDADSGRRIWDRNIIADFHGKLPTWCLAGSPLIDGNKVIVCPGGPNAAVVALDKQNGHTLWAGGGSDIPGYATPLIATLNGQRQYVVFAGHALLGVSPAHGQLLWSFPWKTELDVNAAAPVVIGNSIFISSGYSHGCALIDIKGNKATQRWFNKNIQAHFSSSIVAGNYLYGDSDPGSLVCLDWRNGMVMWKQSGFEKGGVLGVDGTIIALKGSSGELVMVRLAPNRYQEMGSFRPLGGQSWTAPVLANGLLIVRNTKALACYQLK